ncbi:hypothetical protein FVEG_16054 [Fusarium verticillioides 7600]|uniref:Uncharacterized protein n=1 Tax=Gibberella moniliformis (strain M3125 / FGSC 7600) TaxID=334819 RepID=W7MQV7_GIBM7|nr:hypothetical protein FVEG_16054 [Fusarium verticillioides 7600]EWG47002.1 hypothetical protein FVEG_16054 [Fusarium verticillioides 7600]
MSAEFIMLNCVDPHTTSLVTFDIRPPGHLLVPRSCVDVVPF